MRKYEVFTESVLEFRNLVYMGSTALKKLRSPQLRTMLNDNQKFRDKFKGERCFILGNGPSVKEQDLRLLQGEHIFCVNQCMRNPVILELEPEFYVCVDHNFFTINADDPGDMELLNTFRLLGCSKQTECFFPAAAKEAFVEKFGLEQELNVHYILEGLEFTEKFSRDFDLTKRIPSFGTVVQTAIAIAVYMGFSEIILLGVDTTGIVVTINSALKKSNAEYYAYDVSENETRRMENMVARSGFENYCMAYYWTVRAFRRLNNYCTQRNIRLINCSGTTVVDSIPRLPYEKVVMNGHGK